MRVPLSWLLEYAAGGPGTGSPPRWPGGSPRPAWRSSRSSRSGTTSAACVVAEVTAIEELTGFKKPIRYCQVNTGGGEPRGVICGAVNFAAGDRVPLALPGAHAARRVRDRRPEDLRAHVGGHDLLRGRARPSATITPASWCCRRTRRWAPTSWPTPGCATTCWTSRSPRTRATRCRSAAWPGSWRSPTGCRFTDPADADLPADVDGGVRRRSTRPASRTRPPATGSCCARCTGSTRRRPTPLWMRVRLARSGMRSVSLAVDITNYLMLELGQPLHAFDRDRLTGPIVVRRARPGERLETLDHVVRDLDPEDILITDSSGPDLAGRHHGRPGHRDHRGTSRDLVIEAAHFDARATARMSRRHRLFSEASSRFERGVDRELPLRASAGPCRCWPALGGGTVVPGCTHAAGGRAARCRSRWRPDYPDRVAGMVYGRTRCCAGCARSAAR